MSCSADGKSIECDGMVQETCAAGQLCNPMTLVCEDACAVTADNPQSIGCEFYAVDMDSTKFDYCFAVFVVNPSDVPASLTVSRDGAQLTVEDFTRLIGGKGDAITYDPYDNTQGLAPGEAAVLFLSGYQGTDSTVCPVAPAVSGDAGITGTGIGSAFQITSTAPVAAYQIQPYGGGSGGFPNVAVTGASLLLPTSAWGLQYLAVNAYDSTFVGSAPSMNLVAMASDTTITIVPVADVGGGGGVPMGIANQPLNVTLNMGEYVQITQPASLTGSVITSNKPIGHFAGHTCMNVPVGVGYCDHGEQMIPPLRALGNEYIGVMYRPRGGEPAIWRIVGVVDGTQLTFTPDVGGPLSVDQGEVAEFVTDTPFVVQSQDADHPFLLLTYMSGSQWPQLSFQGAGDPDFVISVPPDQYRRRYVFFSDPNYPETNLVFVRRKVNGVFLEVTLDCAGAIGGWQAVGEYEWARVDLTTDDFQDVGGCSTGAHEAYSDGPFGLWNWGWGTPATTLPTSNISYGYPAGMQLAPINTVTFP